MTLYQRTIHSKPALRWLFGLTLFLILLLLAYDQSRSIARSSELLWYSITPPLVAVILAFITHRLIASLFIAVIIGGFLSELTSGRWLYGSVKSGVYIANALTDPWSLKILAFVILILTMINIMIASGGLAALIQRLLRYTRSQRSTQFTAMLLGLAVFIDDYANTMIIGSSMRPVADKQYISREKLAFIVDATSAPIAGIAVISTWIGFEAGLFSQISDSLSLGKDGYSMFFDALGFRFYCFLMIGFLFLNILLQRDYAGMHKAQLRAWHEHKVLADDARPLTSKGFSLSEPENGVRHRLPVALLPIGVLFAVLLCGLWIDGGGLTYSRQHLLSFLSPTVWLDVISHTQNNATLLMLAAFCGLVTAAISALVLAKLSRQILFRTFIKGIQSGLLPMAILLLAWSLKSSCDDLGTGAFLATTAGQTVSPLWFPALIFLLASLVSFGTGTSWGTMSILIPTMLPIAYQLDGNSYGPVTMITMGAILDGAIFGDHCSPISDTTLMSSIASGCDHLHHVETQLPYALTVGVTALIFGYLPAALGYNAGLSFMLGLLVLSLVLLTLGKKTH